MVSPRDRPIRVVIVDDHRVLRDGLRMVLERVPGIEFVGEAGSAAEGAEVVARCRPDVVVMDLEMPGGDGIEGMELTRRELPGVPVVMLSIHATREDVARSLEAGANGFVAKASADTALVAAIRRAADGQPPEIPDGAGDDGVPGEVRDPLRDLSTREREVFLLLARGHGNREVADILGVSPRTVETHRAHVMTKLGAANRADLVRQALRAGLLGPGVGGTV